MKTSTIIRYAVSAALLTIGWLGMLTHFSDTWLFFCISILVLPDDYHDCPDLSDTGMRRWLRSFVIRLVLIMAVLIVIYFLHDLIFEAMGRVFHHPAFIIPVWLLSLWALYRRWHRQRSVADA